MVDRIRKIVSKTEDENGHPVGYAESVAAKINKSDLPVPIQKVDSWLRRLVPMKSEEDCLYCKLISCSILGGGFFYICKQARTTVQKYPKGLSRTVYGVVTTSVALGVGGLATALWFDIDVPDMSDMKDKLKKSLYTETKKVEIGNKVDRKSDKDGD